MDPSTNGGKNGRRLVLKGITKDFAGLRALDDVDLQLEQGEILGLIGPTARARPR